MKIKPAVAIKLLVDTVCVDSCTCGRIGVSPLCHASSCRVWKLSEYLAVCMRVANRPSWQRGISKGASQGTQPTKKPVKPD